MKKGIVFNIHPSTESGLVIQIEEVVYEGDLIKWCGRKRKLLRETLLELAGAKEKEPLKILMELESVHARKSGRRESLDTIDYSTINVDYKRAIPVLKELAASGKLYFERKQVFANFFGAAELDFHFSNDPGGGIVVKGVIKTPSREYSISECALIARGEPNWHIKNGSLYLFKNSLSWKWVKYIRENEGVVLIREEAASIIAELTEEKEMGAPRVVAEQALIQPPSPLPVLELTDATGAFANLTMDYGKGERPEVDAYFEGWRNREAELSWKKDLLESGFIEKRVGASSYYCPLDKVKETLLFLLELGWEVRDSQDRRVEAKSSASFTLQSEEESLLVKGEVKFGEHKARLEDIISAIKKNALFVPLVTGHVGLLSFGGEAKVFAGLSEGEILGAGIKVKKHDLSTLQDLMEAKADVVAEDSLEIIRENLSGEGPGKVSPGKAFRGKLRDYQEEGVGWLSFLYRCGMHGILADDMGLGKTVQVLAFLSTIEITKPVLIVAPASLLFNWRLELERFLPSLSVTVHHGAERPENPERLSEFDVIITSYSILRADQDLLEKIDFLCTVLDEAQSIKNAKTQAARAACRLRSQFRLSLTGTPIENHAGELFSQFRYLIPGLFEGQEELNPKLGLEDPLFFQRVKKKVKPFILRRRKGDVGEQLPEKIEQTVWLEMSPEERKVYEGFLSGIKQGIMKKVNTDGFGKHRMEVFEAILRLRQICCHPLLVSSVLDVEPSARSVKCETLFSDLEILLEEGQKILLFSQFTSMLSILGRKCSLAGWCPLFLDGSTKDREGVVRQFQEESGPKLFLISLKAGGVGLNLTAADYVILYEPWWNEAVENQAIDRAHRIGRKDTVIAKRYVFKDTIEERIVEMKKKKRALSESLFDENPSFEEEDLDFLFS